MIDAKNKFREGYILLLRPFQFAELNNPIQKLTILWAYSEQPVTKRQLNEKGRELVDEAEARHRFSFFGQDRDEWLNEEIDKIFSDHSNIEHLYEGEIVQAYIEGQMCRFYPDEYNILNKERLFEIMQEDGYHAIISPELYRMKEFNEKAHYLQSRGISKNNSHKWASLAFGPFVLYKPYYQLLDMFAREHEIIPDKFYEEVEGITFKETA